MLGLGEVTTNEQVKNHPLVKNVNEEEQKDIDLMQF